MQLVLKVTDISKENNMYSYTCRDKFGVVYNFKFKCYKLIDSYILVSIKYYNELFTASHYILYVNYIQDLFIINNKLVTKDNKPVKSDYISEVAKAYIGFKGEYIQLEKELKTLLNSRISVEDYKQMQDVENSINRLKIKIAENKRYYSI